MFFKRAPKVEELAGSDRLRALLRQYLPDADLATREIVLAFAGLLACVAYADRRYGPAELERTRQALARVEGIDQRGVEAISAVLHDQVVEIAAINPQAYTRVLRERADVGLRRELLDVLVDLAAADGELALTETDLLRRTASAMGLTADDYTASQARYRDKLRLLR